jgi:hypothetical protein
MPRQPASMEVVKENAAKKAAETESGLAGA